MRRLVIGMTALGLCWLLAGEIRSADLDDSRKLSDPASRPPQDAPKPAELAGRNDPEKYKIGFARGRAEAQQELDKNQAKIWTYGLTLGMDLLDRPTGLYNSGFGCVVDDELIGRVEGHNARIAESIRENGYPKNSFKPWEKELYGLKRYFESRNQAEKPIRLVAGGPEVRSPDGKFAVQLVKRLITFPPELKLEPRQGTFLIVNQKDDSLSRILIFSEEIELTWGPKGSWFAVIQARPSAVEGMALIAVDLQTSRMIRSEPRDEQP